MEHNENHLTPESATDEPVSPSYPSADVPGFDPVPLRFRADGITPEKQREYVEALADTGVARYAAARIGVSEQAINRLRRRADARSFDLACEAARRHGARRLHAIAWERAVEGTVKRHYYHGELKSEERVYDNRLLVYLLGKTEHLVAPPKESQAVAEHWQPWVQAIGEGAPPPDIRPDWEREEAEQAAREAEEVGDEESFDGSEVWEDDDGIQWTTFPPPADFEGEELGRPGDPDYRRFLSEAEREIYEEGDEEAARERTERISRLCARRDEYFGFAGGLAEEDYF